MIKCRIGFIEIRSRPLSLKKEVSPAQAMRILSAVYWSRTVPACFSCTAIHRTASRRCRPCSRATYRCCSASWTTQVDALTATANFDSRSRLNGLSRCPPLQLCKFSTRIVSIFFFIIIICVTVNARTPCSKWFQWFLTMLYG